MTSRLFCVKIWRLAIARLQWNDREFKMIKRMEGRAKDFFFFNLEFWGNYEIS